MSIEKSIPEEEQKLLSLRNEIVKLLNIDHDDEGEIFELNVYILDKIKTYKEHFLVYAFLRTTQQLNNHEINTENLPGPTHKKLYEKKQSLQRAKERIKKDIKTLQRESSFKLNSNCTKALIQALENIDINMHVFTQRNAEASFKDNKKALYQELVEECSTGVNRAKKITRILNYL